MTSLSKALGWINLALATGLFLAYIPAYFRRDHKLTGAGLIGSGLGILCLPILPTDIARQLAVWAGVLVISVVVSDMAEEQLGTHDDPRIVIDEFIGVWTAMLFIPHTPLMMSMGFVMFRVFDVLKPGWVRKIAALPGGWGIVMDDILAGVLANAVLHAIVRAHMFYVQ